MQVFFRNCTQILTRIQRKKFEDMFLVKIASKGTSLRWLAQRSSVKYRARGSLFINSLKITSRDLRSH